MRDGRDDELERLQQSRERMAELAAGIEVTLRQAERAHASAEAAYERYKERQRPSS